jgi:hypothetical protein
MNRYFYDGPVMEFSSCIQRNWTGETIAGSAKKAKSNLAYRWKKENNRCAGAKISLPGKLTIVD